ncbi:MAG: TetR/AcrR family transcriptional regulator [Proteobacteria bacterium]|nr:MAG: TetR/AcrR family transcriptional regulator [Pseudomonadota bacterium]
MSGDAKTAPDTAAARYEEYLRTRPKQSRSRGVVDAILTATREALSRGEREDRITLQWVAERAGVGIGSLYDYFGDRASVLAGLTAKLTDDNLRELEAELATTDTMALEPALTHLIDVIFEKYVPNPTLGRAILRVAHRIDLMPMLAENQTLFSKTLAAAFRRRSDLRLDDADLTAWTLTQTTMGVIHTMVWSGALPFSQDRLKAELVQMYLARLAPTK